MPYANLNVEFTPQELTDFTAAVTTINTILSGKVVNLTPEERQQLYKMRNNRASFAQRTMLYAADNPHLIPSFADFASAKVDYAYYLLTLQLLQRLTGITEKLNDTNMAVGSETLQFCRLFYNNVKMAAEQDVPGSTSIYEDLNTFFDLPPRPDQDTDTPTEE